MRNRLRIIEICKRIGITQEDLSNRLGISRIALSKSLNGNPTVETLEKIACELNVPVWQLFKGYRDSFVAMVKSGDTFLCTNNPEELISFVEHLKNKDEE